VVVGMFRWKGKQVRIELSRMRRFLVLSDPNDRITRNAFEANPRPVIDLNREDNMTLILPLDTSLRVDRGCALTEIPKRPNGKPERDCHPQDSDADLKKPRTDGRLSR